MGHQLPRRLLVRAAAMAPITDKADDWGGCSAMRHPVLRRTLPSMPRQILKDIPRPPNTASRDD